MRKILTIPEATEILATQGLSHSVRTIKQWIYDEKLEAVKDGKEWKINPYTLDNFILDQKGISSDWIIAAYCRTSKKKDAGKKRLEAAWTRLWPYIHSVCEQENIPLILKPRSWGRYLNVKRYSDTGSINEVKDYDLKGVMDLFRDAALGFCGKGPKIKYLFLEYADRFHKGELSTWWSWAKAMGITVYCQDMDGKGEDEILALSDENTVKSILENLESKKNIGRNLSEKERDALFKPILKRAKVWMKECPEKKKVRHLEGMLIAHRGGDRGVKMAQAMERYMDENNAGSQSGKGGRNG